MVCPTLLKYSLQANLSHFLRRSDEDKAHAAKLALEEFSHLSDRAIASMCGVSQPFVRTIRKQLITVMSSGTCVGMDGKMRKMPTKPAAKANGDSGEQVIEETADGRVTAAILNIAESLASIETRAALKASLSSKVRHDSRPSLGISSPLHTEAADDRLPGGVLEVFWSKVSGHGTAEFSTRNAEYRVTFDQPGHYVLRLTANDSQLSSSDDVAVTGYPAATAPVVIIHAPVDGAHDPIAPPCFGHHLAALIPGARFVEVPDASHGVTIQHATVVNRHLACHFSSPGQKRSFLAE